MVIPTKDFAGCFKQWKRHWETVCGSKVPTLKGTGASLSYVQCFLYLVFSSINISIFHSTQLSGQTSYICIYEDSLLFVVWKNDVFRNLNMRRMVDMKMCCQEWTVPNRDYYLSFIVTLLCCLLAYQKWKSITMSLQIPLPAGALSCSSNGRYQSEIRRQE